MMEKKYQLVAWTRNITDAENARLFVIPSVENDLIEPFTEEIRRCRKKLKRNNGYLSNGLARRFVRVYEQSARLDILTGHIDGAIRFLLLAADYCIYEDCFNWTYWDTDLGSYSYFCGALGNEFVRLCEEALSLAKRHGFEHILEEPEPRRTLKLYLEHTQSKRDLGRHIKRMSAWR